MEGRYLWKGTEFVAPTSRVVDLSNVWLSDDIGDGARLFGITDNDSSWSSLNMRDLSCVWLLLTLLLVTAFADKSSVTTTIDPIAEGGALVHSGLPHYQLDNTTRQPLNRLLWHLLLRQHHSPISIICPRLSSSSAAITTSSISPQRAMVASEAFSCSDHAPPGNSYLSSIVNSTTGYIILFKVWVTMAEGWRLYTGARVVDGHIASLLKHISEVHFQRSIRDINFNCHLAVHRFGHHFTLELTLTETIRDVLGWYPGLLLWHNNDYPWPYIRQVNGWKALA
ncbi:hypothetical protein FRC02_002305 [Tulasnella sp. 418]|nr:hypothetical protein FRC02_002305 [Tulasnella sp. 418]